MAWVAVTCLPVLGCADSGAGSQDMYLGDGSFGAPEDPFKDAAVSDDAQTGGADGGALKGQQVRLRAFQGVINLPKARFCYAPSYVADDPETDADESSQGNEASTLLPLGDAGLVSFAEMTDYVALPAMDHGAITVHAVAAAAAQEADAGADDAGMADAGAAVDEAGTADAGAAMDAAAETDATSDMDADADGAVDSGPSPCAPESMAALLPLPLPITFLNGVMAGDAGDDAALADPDGGAALDPEQRGLVTTASDGDVLTLFGSGLLLDEVELARRAELARMRYLDQAPGDEGGADAAARRVRLELLRVYGPRFLLARGAAPERGQAALTLAHLVPDVPAAAGMLPAPERGSGALHVCVTVDAKESELGDGGAASVDFRSVAPIGTALAPDASYRFRVFVEADFKALTNSCATTSLKPVAELELKAGDLRKNRSYTLIAWGAYAPSATCVSGDGGSLIQPGCALPNDMLGARLELLENQLPAP